jgi:hypothetical protein
MADKTAGEPTWHTVSRCDGGQCVQIGSLGKSVLFRSSEDPDGACVTLSRTEWREFLDAAKDGEFDNL